MGTLFKALAISALLLAPASAADAQVSFSVTIGPPPAWRASRIAPQPGPDFVWIDGYWYPVGRRYVWHQGYWTRPPFPDAYWIEPYYNGRQWIGGYWDSDRGPRSHDHRWDKVRWRDDERNRGRGRGRGREDRE